MKKRLFIIGNGFDLEHEMPTSYKNDFKEIAKANEQIDYFWDIYQSEEADIWSHFEHCLGKPDFNNLEQIFEGYAPDYMSDHESDRDCIITQVDLNGNLYKSLYQFADNAENYLNYISGKNKYYDLFCSNDLFLSFNYTHTLEKIYNIDESQIIHIHGEVGKDNLLLGYPEGEYKPEKYLLDVRRKGRGPYVELEIGEYIERIENDEDSDYYVNQAYKELKYKTESFYKKNQNNKLEIFVNEEIIDNIVVLGHSCNIDFEYFKILNQRYPLALWEFNPFDSNTYDNVEKAIKMIGIKNTKIN